MCDSLFVMVDLCVDGVDNCYCIKVCNFLFVGMMGEGMVCVLCGDWVYVNICNSGWIEGMIVWV